MLDHVGWRRFRFEKLVWFNIAPLSNWDDGNFAFSPFAVPPFCCQGGWKAPSISSKEMMVMTVVGALVGLIRIK